MISPVDSLRAIWEEQRSNVLERVSLLERAAVALDAGELAEPLREEAWRAAHMLAGAVGTFGFAGASLAARELEAKLADPSLADAGEISPLVVALRRDLEGEPFTPGEPAPAVGESVLPVPVPEGEGLRVLLVDDEEDYCQRVAMKAEALGIDLDIALSPQQVRSVCASRRPALVLLRARRLCAQTQADHLGRLSWAQEPDASRNRSKIARAVQAKVSTSTIRACVRSLRSRIALLDIGGGR